MSCLWPLDEAALTDEWHELPQHVRDRAHALASSTLVRLTGWRVGTCAITIRPCRPVHSVNSGYGPWGMGVSVQNWGGAWSNNACGPGCSHPCAVSLPGPVGRVVQVKVDGAIIAPTLYRIDNGHELTWTGSLPCPFPQTQNFALDDNQPGTMSVTYVNAHLPGVEGTYAVTILAMELAEAMAGRQCRLPTGVTSIVRQGISMEIASGAFPGGITGIHEVDVFIALWNPGGIITPSTFWAPGEPTHRRIGS